MNQQNINPQNEFRPATEETFFDSADAATIPAVMPLDETPTRTGARFQKFRVPMRKPNNSFNPAFLIMAMLAVAALGVIAGTLLYRASAEKSANNTATDEPVNRTIPAQYQFVVEKPPAQSLPKDNSSVSTTTTAPLKKESRSKEESSAPDADNEPKDNKSEEIVKENEAEAPSVEDEEPPPIPGKKEDKKQNKGKGKEKNKNNKPETKEDAEVSDDGGDI